MKRIYLDYASTTPVDKEVLEAMLPYFGNVGDVGNVRGVGNAPFDALRASQAKRSNNSNNPPVGGDQTIPTQRPGWGNPGSLHSFGQEASAAVFKARREIADILGVHYEQIVFTGSATEANNLALRGALNCVRNVLNVGSVGDEQAERSNNPPSGGDRTSRTIPTQKLNIVVSAIEHESVMETAKALEEDGVQLRIVPVLKNGQVDLKKLEKLIDKNTVLVSIMYANNEIGCVQPIAKIAEIVRDFRVRNVGAVGNLPAGKAGVGDGQAKRSNNPPSGGDRTSRTIPTQERIYPLLHTDAVQAFQYLDCKPEELGVDLMTLSSHKIYGPKGIGLLYVRNVGAVGNVGDGQAKRSNNPPSGGDRTLRTIPTLAPLVQGGGQEDGLRSGTENTPSIVGFAKAVEIADKLREKETKRICDLRDWFLVELLKIFPKAKLNGQKRWRLPNNINLNLGGISSEQSMTFLDLNGVAVSAGSACSARSLEASKTLLAIGLSEKEAKSSLRITLGRQTKKEELKRALKIFKAMKKALK